jgi:DNA polymerase-1
VVPSSQSSAVRPEGPPAPDGRPTLLLVDGSGYVFRAYHALPHLSTKDGTPTNAVYGFTNMLLKALREADPSHLAVVFDLGGSAARSAIDPSYKQNRTVPPGDLAQQFPLVREVVRALDLPLLEIAGVEADDIIGTLARQGAQAGFRVVILTGDKDFMQIVSEDVWLYDSMRDRWTGPKEVQEKLGLRPEQVIDYMALLGDAVDNVPGVPGVGPKTASQLIQSFGTVDRLYGHLEEVQKEKLRALLAEHEGSVRRARQLVTLQTELALPVAPADLARKPPRTVELRELFARLEFGRLLRELPAGAPGSKEGIGPVTAAQLQLAAPEVVVNAVALGSALAALPADGALALYVELGEAGEQAREAVGLALAFEAKGARRALYLPLGHAGPRGKAEPAAIEVVAKVLADPSRQKIGFGLKRSWTALKPLGIELRGMAFDSEVALYLTDPGRREHVLAEVVPQRFGTPLPAIEPLQHTRRKIPLSEFLPELVAPRATACAEAAMGLQSLLLPELERLGLLDLFRDLEMPLLPVLARMEWTGVRVDLAALASMAREVDAQLGRLTEKIYELAGSVFNVASNRQLSEVLFKTLSLPVLRRTKTGPSTDQDVLEKLAAQHPLPAAVLEVRQLAKLKGTYIDALPLLVDARDGRVHTTFNQSTAATGRLSSSDPNLQNIPTRTDLGRRIREAFIASPGKVLVSADYNQIELRILAHMSKDPALVEAFGRELDIHTQTASEVFSVGAKDVTAEMRRVAKAINFGIAYGLSAFGLAQRLEMPGAEAQRIIDRYFERYRGVRAWLEATIEEARREGCVSTLFGRRRFLSDIHSRNPAARQAAERMAVNAPIQGTAADLIKRAMLRADAALREGNVAASMTLQVHDELVFEATEAEASRVAEIARRSMGEAGQLDVPLLVTVGIGSNWAGAH